MAHGGGWQNPMRFAAVALKPAEVSRTNIPTHAASFYLLRLAARSKPCRPPRHFCSRISYSMKHSHRRGSLLL
jgi:hypothetical protein